MSLEEARNLVGKEDYEKAEAQFLAVLNHQDAAQPQSISNKDAQEKEQCILELGQLYGTTHQLKKLCSGTSVRLIKPLAPVSYTHLDVYKRQVLEHPQIRFIVQH